MFALSKLILPLVAAGLLVGVIFLAHKVGTLDGAAEVRKEWDKVEADRRQVVQALKEEIAGKESVHQLESKRISDELALSTAEHQATIARLESDYANRLLLSTTRADVYKRQAQGGAVERDALAQHAANLDRSLEEGRRLVRELRDTLEQREVAIGVLGTQILLDRNLFSESSE